MAHDYLTGQSVQAETGRASALLIGTMLGGVLALNSYLAGWIYGDPVYADLLAFFAAIGLGLPIVWQGGRAVLREPAPDHPCRLSGNLAP